MTDNLFVSEMQVSGKVDHGMPPLSGLAMP